MKNLALIFWTLALAFLTEFHALADEPEEGPPSRITAGKTDVPAMEEEPALDSDEHRVRIMVTIRLPNGKTTSLGDDWFNPKDLEGIKIGQRIKVNVDVGGDYIKKVHEKDGLLANQSYEVIDIRY